MSSDTKLQRLQYFLALAETGSLSKAALQLGIGKPRVRRAVQALEERLGVALLEPAGRRLMLTDAGRRFHDRCAAILSDADSIADGGGSQELRGTVAVGLPPIAAKLIAAPLLKAVTVQFPDIQLALLEGYSFNVREWLNEGRVDIGLYYDGPGARGAFAAPVIREHLLLVGAGGDPRLSASQFTLREALQFPLMAPSRPHGARLQIEWLAESHGFGLKVAMEVDSLPLMVRLLTGGFGYALLPAVAVADELRRGVLRAVTIDPPFTRTLLLGRSARRVTSSRAERLAPLLTQLIGEHCHGMDQYGRRVTGGEA